MAIFEYRDILFNIKSFLNNNDIIELILSSKKIYEILGNKNIFTSITIYKDSNICDMIRFYLQNKVSIIRTIMIDMNNLEDIIDIWPYSSTFMIFVNCNAEKKCIHKIDKKYKNCSTKIIKYRYQYNCN